MRSWSLLLGGLLIWAAHFFAVYAIASLLPGQELARWLSLAATLPAAAAAGLIIRNALRRAGGETVDGLMRIAGGAGALLSLLGVLWQGFPAVFL